MGAWLYVLKCADTSYYTGTTRAELEKRIAEHQARTFGGYTATRLPVRLIYSQYFEQITDAIAAERQIKRWSRRKKEALIAGDFENLRVYAKRQTAFGPRPSRGGFAAAPQEDDRE